MSKYKCDVVLTYGWNRVAYNVLRNLSENGLKVVVGDESKTNMCSVSRLSMSSFQYPSPFEHPEEFIDKLIDVVSKYKPSVLIPCHEESIVIAKYIDRFPDDLIIPIPDYETLLKAHNKRNSTKLALNIGVPTPMVYKPESEAELVELLPKLVFPIVVKDPMSNASKGVFYAKSSDSLLELYKKYYDFTKRKNDRVFLQEFVDGTGYGASFLYHHGEMVTGIVHKRLVEKNHTGGVSTRRSSVKNDDILAYGKKMLDTLEWHGPAMVEFKHNESTGQIWFIEINARYWGSLALAIAAGLDIPYWHYSYSMNNKIKINNYKLGVESKWILGDIIAFVDRVIGREVTKGDLAKILNYQADNFDDYKSDDKKVFFAQCYYYLSKLFKSRTLTPQGDKYHG